MRPLKFTLDGGLNTLTLKGRLHGRGHLAFQRRKLTYWSTVVEREEESTYILFVAATGEELPAGYNVEYLGTAMSTAEDIVLHLYRLDPKE